MTVGELIKNALDTKRISQIELSERTGISTSQISRIVKGDRGTSIENLVAIADVLGIKRDLMLRTAAGLPNPEIDNDEWLEDMNDKMKLIPKGSRSIAEKVLDALIVEPAHPLLVDTARRRRMKHVMPLADFDTLARPDSANLYSQRTGVLFISFSHAFSFDTQRSPVHEYGAAGDNNCAFPSTWQR